MAILLGDPGKYGYEDGPPEKAKLVSPVGLCFRGWTLYIAENPLDFQGSIRVYSKLTDLIYFKQVWQKIPRSFGILLRGELNFLKSKGNSTTENLTKKVLLEGKEQLLSAATDLQHLILTIREKTKGNSLDIVHGSMSSRTVKAVFITLCNSLLYLFGYFSYSSNKAMLNKINMKCLTTRLVEFFLWPCHSKMPSQ